MQDYDEDLSCNPFLKFLTQNYSILYEEAIKNQWILCVPSVKSLKSEKFDEHFVRSHLILQDGCATKTLANEPVKIEDNLLKFESSEMKILFRETFYSSTGKISAYCIDQQENKLKKINNSSNSGYPTSSQKRVIRESVKHIKLLLKEYSNDDTSLSNPNKQEECINNIKNHISEMDSKIVNCVVFNLYHQLVEFLTLTVSVEDQELNKIRRNLFERSIEELQVPQSFTTCIDEAVLKLDGLSQKKTIEGKFESLKQTVKFLGEAETTTDLDADNLISLFSLLIIRSSVTNWCAQLSFMKHFNAQPSFGEESYFLATLEAALSHVKGGTFAELQNVSPSSKFDLFYSARIGDAPALEEILSNSKFKCHPLCECHRCIPSAVVNATDKNANGLTALHYACMYGHTDVTQILLRSAFRDNVDSRDDKGGRTALHWSAYRGNQTCLLLLCHQKCNLNLTDKQGNTALHLAVLNGHESCVKALLYYAEQDHFRLQLDARNQDGNTALHLAARWGYSNIVGLLLQWDADTTVTNFNNETAINLAQNIKLSQLLSSNTMTTGKGASRPFWTGITRQLSLRRKNP